VVDLANAILSSVSPLSENPARRGEVVVVVAALVAVVASEEGRSSSSEQDANDMSVVQPSGDEGVGEGVRQGEAGREEGEGRGGQNELGRDMFFLMAV
jgi:hypothetical protein